jgi:hypothetical protein
MTRALLLNASFEPHAVISDRRAVVLYMKEKADVEVYSGREFRSAGMRVAVPAVLRLRQYVVMPEKHRSIMLITPNVLARDGYVCGYCGKDELRAGVDGTMDHVVPKAKGGPHKWENVTAACFRCNHRKGDRTLEEMAELEGADRWTLDRKPFRPKGVSAHLLKIRPDPCWKPYLQVA